MTHYIIVRYKDSVDERKRLNQEIAELFHRATRLEGVHSVSLFPAVLASEKRYDLMIRMDMRKESLDIFDQSDIHRLWKERFSRYIAHKVIFDCE